MIYFLASNPIVYDAKRLNPANHFLEKIRSSLPEVCSALFICSNPMDFDFTDSYAEDVRIAFESEGIIFEHYAVLDGRTVDKAAELVSDADLIFLAGGHVPTQNAFFHDIKMSGLLHNSQKIVIGSSAGSMNAAEVVYAQPEEEGEATSNHYQRFLRGLGLTKIQLIPHYQETKNHILDGLRLFDDVTYPDSMGHDFYAICDGSFLYGNGSTEMIYGEAYLIKDGLLAQLTSSNEIYHFRK